MLIHFTAPQTSRLRIGTRTRPRNRRVFNPHLQQARDAPNMKHRPLQTSLSPPQPPPRPRGGGFPWAVHRLPRPAFTGPSGRGRGSYPAQQVIRPRQGAYSHTQSTTPTSHADTAIDNTSINAALPTSYMTKRGEMKNNESTSKTRSQPIQRRTGRQNQRLQGFPYRDLFTGIIIPVRKSLQGSTCKLVEETKWRALSVFLRSWAALGRRIIRVEAERGKRGRLEFQPFPQDVQQGLVVLPVFGVYKDLLLRRHSAVSLHEIYQTHGVVVPGFSVQHPHYFNGEGPLGLGLPLLLFEDVAFQLHQLLLAVDVLHHEICLRCYCYPVDLEDDRRRELDLHDFLGPRRQLHQLREGSRVRLAVVLNKGADRSNGVPSLQQNKHRLLKGFTIARAQGIGLLKSNYVAYSYHKLVERIHFVDSERNFVDAEKEGGQAGVSFARLKILYSGNSISTTRPTFALHRFSTTSSPQIV